MKIKLIIIITIIISLLSCELLLEKDAATSSVVINVPPGIKKIHIAVFNSEVKPENMLMKQSYNPSNKVLMNVPSGPDRIFLVVTENDAGFAWHSGTSEPVQLTPGRNSNLNITLQNIELDLYYNYNEKSTEWNNIVGADLYRLVSSSNYYGAYTKVDETQNPKINYNFEHNPNNYYKFQAHFTYFGIYYESGIYDFNGEGFTPVDEATVKISIIDSNLSAATRIHVAVYKGITYPENLIVKKNFNVAYNLQMFVPEEYNLTFLVIVENSGKAIQVGMLGQISLYADEINEVNINTEYIYLDITYTQSIKTLPGYPSSWAEWNTVQGASGYSVWEGYYYDNAFTKVDEVQYPKSYYSFRNSTKESEVLYKFQAHFPQFGINYESNIYWLINGEMQIFYGYEPQYSGKQ